MRNCFVILLLASVMTASGQNRENPVIKRVADAGVLKYAGKYYLGGVATHGDFYVSSDLTHWVVQCQLLGTRPTYRAYHPCHVAYDYRPFPRSER